MAKINNPSSTVILEIYNIMRAAGNLKIKLTAKRMNILLKQQQPESCNDFLEYQGETGIQNMAEMANETDFEGTNDG